MKEFYFNLASKNKNSIRKAQFSELLKKLALKMGKKIHSIKQCKKHVPELNLQL